jgi:secondary thiamine-phosphate synthase enzyme
MIASRSGASAAGLATTPASAAAHQPDSTGYAGPAARTTKGNRLRHNTIVAPTMKSYRKELWFEVPTRRAFLNITSEVEQCLRESQVREGLALVNAMHITASVFINDDESGLHHDYEQWLEQLAPHEPVSKYRHNRTGEDNADAHLKRQVMGREVVVAITGGKLDFGPWEQIFYGEFDGRRKKRVLVKIIGE